MLSNLHTALWGEIFLSILEMRVLRWLAQHLRKLIQTILNSQWWFFVYSESDTCLVETILPVLKFGLSLNCWCLWYSSPDSGQWTTIPNQPHEWIVDPVTTIPQQYCHSFFFFTFVQYSISYVRYLALYCATDSVRWFPQL